MSSQEVWGGGAQSQQQRTRGRAGRAATQMAPLLQQTLGAHERPVTLVRSTGGDPPRGLWAPPLGRRAESKLYTTQHHQGAGAAPAVTALKCRHMLSLVRGCPVSLRGPGARSSSPSLLGPAGKASRMKRRLPRLWGPPVLKGWQKRRTQLLSVRSRGTSREIWALREKGREMLWSPS